MSMKEVLEKFYQARTPIERHELKQELIKAITSCVYEPEAKEFVEVLVKLLHEHRYYRELVLKLRGVFEEILS